MPAFHQKSLVVIVNLRCCSHCSPKCHTLPVAVAYYMCGMHAGQSCVQYRYRRSSLLLATTTSPGKLSTRRGNCAGQWESGGLKPGLYRPRLRRQAIMGSYMLMTASLTPSWQPGCLHFAVGRSLPSLMPPGAQCTDFYCC
jgi:hypothetical protein